jgi:hypothetical protein
MALHRDIFWVGRQWAVTGFGVQAVDQRLKGAFDVEATRVWEDDLPQRMRSLAWINIDDFNKALGMARERFPEPPRKKTRPLVESVLELMQPPAQETPKPAPAMEVSLPKTVAKEASQPKTIAMDASPRPAKSAAVEIPVEPPPSKSQPLAMRIEHASAKFLPRWRVRHGSSQ